MLTIPAKHSLIGSIVDGEDGRGEAQAPVFRALCHHKRHKGRMMVVTMDDIWQDFPLVYPLEDCALEGDIALYFVAVERVVVVSIYAWSVKFAGDIGDIEVITEFFVDDVCDAEFYIGASHMKAAGMCFAVFLLGEPCIMVSGDDDGDPGIAGFVEVSGQ